MIALGAGLAIAIGLWLSAESDLKDDAVWRDADMRRWREAQRWGL